jgi:group I intron endonuclease
VNETTNGEWNTTNVTSTKSEEKPESVITKRKIVGIYGLRNKITSKWYIGQSRRSIEKRWNAYERLQCRNQVKLYNAIVKYGFSSFDKVILEECEPTISKKELDSKETIWIHFYDSYKNGYNMTLGGEGMCGKPVAVSTRKKLAEANKNRIYRPHTEEAKKKMSIANIGRKASEKTKEKMRNRTWSESHRKSFMESLSRSRSQGKPIGRPRKKQ